MEQVMMRLRASPGAGAAQVNGSRSGHLRAVMLGGTASCLPADLGEGKRPPGTQALQLSLAGALLMALVSLLLAQPLQQ